MVAKTITTQYPPTTAAGGTTQYSSTTAAGGFGSGPGIGSGPVKDVMTGTGVIRYRPWVTLECCGAAEVREVIQPASQWLAGAHAPNFHILVEISYCNGGCTLYLESSPTPEGPWNAVTSFAASTDTTVVISSEGGSTKFSGYVRWRVAGTAPWQICFHLKAMPGLSVTEHIGTPRKV